MTDQEITELCARAMGYKLDHKGTAFNKPDRELPLYVEVQGYGGLLYNPLQDDAQAMALVKKLEISIDNPHRCDASLWRASMFGSEATDENLNRAICLCAAKVQKQKETQ